MTHPTSEGPAWYIGVMSGSSLDAIDVGVFAFDGAGPADLIAHHCHPIPEELRREVVALAEPGTSELARTGVLDHRFGELIAEAVNTLLAKHQIHRRDIAAVGSHGQTIRHDPNHAHPFTWQVGDPNLIAELTGLVVVADFRRRDLAVGGQGAPLACGFHAARFRGPNARMVLNLGGIANLTCLPPADQTVPVVGFDTGPANLLMDAWCQRHRNTPFDADGAWASGAAPDEALLDRLLRHPFLQAPPPKSTGREDFTLRWLELQLAEVNEVDPVQVQATLLAFTAQSISAAIDRWGNEGGLFLCGGGSRNRALVEALRSRLPETSITTTASLGLEPQWVEAATFAWLARERLAGRPGNLPSVTGAERAVPLGGLYVA
ncbi:MAG: anhydro-N-acetylmuramic acid kinase [Pseudomonadota bacterium]|nr:anhydro-N-acetylmuramic acid kinase [Pseudomonadota bacterium]